MAITIEELATSQSWSTDDQQRFERVFHVKGTATSVLARQKVEDTNVNPLQVGFLTRKSIDI